MRGTPSETVHIPLAAGLAQKLDDRARQPPALDIAKDIQFDELGGIQTRLPYDNVHTGVSAVRKAVANADEIAYFSKAALNTYDAITGDVVQRAEYLAIKMDEVSRFATTDDQVTCDRAELNNVVAYAWASSAGLCYLAAIDKTTGTTILAPTQIPEAISRVRLVALTTKILLFYVDGDTSLAVYSLDPSDLAGSFASTTIIVASPDFNSYYDACRIASTDVAAVVARRTPTTSYSVARVTAAGVVTATTKARTCDGPIAISAAPNGTQLQVVRANVGNIQGDRLTVSSLADEATGQAVGTATGTVNQIAAAHRSVTDSGQYRCYAFWSSAEATGFTDWQSRYNYVDTGGSLGTEATFIRRMGIASRAFSHDGRVYVWGVFALQSSFSGANDSAFRAQLQNTYFMYRDDATLHAKAATGRAGGHVAVTGHLPGVALVSGTTQYAWCGVERRIVSLGGANHRGYSDRGPRDILLTFDSQECRRAARLGATLYIASALGLHAWDGEKLAETGFLIYPYSFGAIEVATGNVADGEYALKLAYRWDNARGERERSTTATVGTVTIAAGPNGISIPNTLGPLYHTLKQGSTHRPVAIEYFRTAVNPNEDAPFYLGSSNDPIATSNPNRYMANDPSLSTIATFNDELADSALTALELHPENGATLENLAPPACSIVIASDTRLFLAGVAGDPNRVHYSKLRGDGEIAAFHDALTIDVPFTGGAITALAFLNETLVVFRETAVYALPGDGFDNVGNGQNYGPARLISSDVGATTHEAVVLTPQGLMFKSSKGWYLLNRGWSVEYIGAPVSDYDSEAVVGADTLEARHQVRISTSSRMLVFDYLAQQWAEWTISGANSSCVWGGSHVYSTTSEGFVEQSAYSSLTHGIDIETAWIKVGGLQDMGRVRAIMLLGEYRSAHSLRIRIAYDYSSTYVDDEIWPTSPTTVGGPLQVKIGPSRQRCQAIKIRITALAPEAAATLDTDPGLSPLAMSSAGAWNAILTWDTAGVGGNSGVLDYVITSASQPSGGGAAIEVRDSQRYDIASTSWVAATSTIGVAIYDSNASGLNVDDLETEIDNMSSLATVTTPDAVHASNELAYPGTPTRSQGSFSGGTATSDPPTGEALKLTGLALDVARQQGLYKRLPAAQRT